MDTIAATPFLTMVGWSVAILVLHISLQASLSTLELGSAWNAGPRDEEKKPKGALAGRAARASENFRETYPAFIALALALAIMGDSSGWGMTGAWTWIVARIVYIPLYLAGIPYIRSLVWVVSLLGLAMMFFAVIG